MSLSDIPAGSQLQERLHNAGASALSDVELLAIVLGTEGTGTDVVHLAQQLLAEHQGWTGLLRVSYTELCGQHGMGEAQVATLKASLEVGRRLLIAGVDARPQIKTSTDVANLLILEMSHLEQEELRAVLLDTKNRVQQIVTVYVGSVNSALVRVGEVFRDAVRRNSTAIIIAHNHPSGDPSPSPEDLLVTQQIVQAGRLLNIEVLDHLVIGCGRYVSMRQRNLGFA